MGISDGLGMGILLAWEQEFCWPGNGNSVGLGMGILLAWEWEF